jgi:hypothetical protein
MKRLLLSVLAIASVCAIGYGGWIGYKSYQVRQAYNVQNCGTPIMHLDRADVAVCLEPNISWVDLTLGRSARINAFTHAIAQIPGVDLETSRTDDRHKLFRIVYYMSETSDGQFITNLVAAINKPGLYEEN